MAFISNYLIIYCLNSSPVFIGASSLVLFFMCFNHRSSSKSSAILLISNHFVGFLKISLVCLKK